MYKKGLIMGGSLFPMKGQKNQYSNAQYAIGFYEFQAGNLNEETVPDMIEYFNNTFKDEFFMKGSPVQMRTIPIGKSVKIENIL